MADRHADSSVKDKSIDKDTRIQMSIYSTVFRESLSRLFSDSNDSRPNDLMGWVSIASVHAGCSECPITCIFPFSQAVLSRRPRLRACLSPSDRDP